MPEINHHLEAEKSLMESANANYGSEQETYALAAAQVHALLAVAQAVEKFLVKLDEVDKAVADA